jgi:hypothetical protein
MYRTKEYQERRWEEIKAEVDFASNAYPETQRIFLADGGALNLPTDKLTKIIEYLYLSLSVWNELHPMLCPRICFKKMTKI